MDQEIECPSCGALFTVFVDPRGGEEQVVTIECPACWRPVRYFAREEERGGFAVGVEQPDE